MEGKIQYERERKSTAGYDRKLPIKYISATQDSIWEGPLSFHLSISARSAA